MSHLTNATRTLALLLAVLTVGFVFPAALCGQEADDLKPEDKSADEKSAEEVAGPDRPDPFEGLSPDRPDPFEGLAPADDPLEGLIDDISENMKRIEDLLNQKDTGDSTQSLQRQTIKKIDELIEVASKAMQQSPGGSGSPQQKSQKKDQSQKDQKESQKQQEMSEKEQLEELKRQEQQKKDQQKDQEQDSPEKVPNNGKTEGENPEAEAGDLKDRNGEGKWGKLPKRVIEQMYDGGRRPLPEKYRLILEEYYRRLPQSTSQ